MPKNRTEKKTVGVVVSKGASDMLHLEHRTEYSRRQDAALLAGVNRLLLILFFIITVSYFVLT